MFVSVYFFEIHQVKILVFDNYQNGSCAFKHRARTQATSSSRWYIQFLRIWNPLLMSSLSTFFQLLRLKWWWRMDEQIAVNGIADALAVRSRTWQSCESQHFMVTVYSIPNFTLQRQLSFYKVLSKSIIIIFVKFYLYWVALLV